MPDEPPVNPATDMLSEIQRLRGKAEDAEKRCQEIQKRLVEL
jgi:hypothetical protein